MGLKRSGGGLKRSPLKNSSRGLKKGGKIKVRPKTEGQRKASQEQWEKDKEFYESIWEVRPHYCECCGKWLGDELKTIFMDHILEKSTHPNLRYEPDNIIVVCFEHHQVKTNGFPHPKHQEAIDKAKEKFL